MIVIMSLLGCTSLVYIASFGELRSTNCFAARILKIQNGYKQPHQQWESNLLTPVPKCNVLSIQPSFGSLVYKNLLSPQGEGSLPTPTNVPLGICSTSTMSEQSSNVIMNVNRTSAWTPVVKGSSLIYKIENKK